MKLSLLNILHAVYFYLFGSQLLQQTFDTRQAEKAFIKLTPYEA
jgi:hypothetical protein